MVRGAVAYATQPLSLLPPPSPAADLDVISERRCVFPTPTSPDSRHRLKPPPTPSDRMGEEMTWSE
eukprot:scaffold9736_cov36-Phaeocystis_antarctica.AAC.2